MASYNWLFVVLGALSCDCISSDAAVALNN